VNSKEVIFLAKTHPEDPSLRQIARPLVAVAPDMPIGEAFSQMMKEHVHLALVRDSGGVVCGIVTLEDILEEIVGDIQDEFDRLPRQIVPSGQSWIVGGGAALGQLRETMGRPTLGEGAGANTAVSDWLQARAGRRLKGGDVIHIDGLQFLVRKMRRQKVFEAMVSTKAAT
jgi:putative hemolysin